MGAINDPAARSLYNDLTKELMSKEISGPSIAARVAHSSVTNKVEILRRTFQEAIERNPKRKEVFESTRRFVESQIKGPSRRSQASEKVQAAKSDGESRIAKTRREKESKAAHTRREEESGTAKTRGYKLEGTFVEFEGSDEEPEEEISESLREQGFTETTDRELQPMNRVAALNKTLFTGRHSLDDILAILEQVPPDVKASLLIRVLNEASTKYIKPNQGESATPILEALHKHPELVTSNRDEQNSVLNAISRILLRITESGLG